MNSKLLLILTICAFFCSSSGASEHLVNRAEKAQKPSGNSENGVKTKIRVEAGVTNTTSLGISRSYGHHEHHHEGYYHHYRRRSLIKTAEPLAEATVNNSANPTISRSYGHHESYHKGHHHYRRRSFTDLGNNELKSTGAVAGKTPSTAIISRGYGHHKSHHKGYRNHYKRQALDDAGKVESESVKAADKGAAVGIEDVKIVGRHRHHRTRAQKVPKEKQMIRSQRIPKKNIGGKNIYVRAVSNLAENVTSVTQAPELAAIENTGKTLINEAPTSGVAVRKAETYYRPSHYGYNGHRSGYH